MVRAVGEGGGGAGKEGEGLQTCSDSPCFEEMQADGALLGGLKGVEGAEDEDDVGHGAADGQDGLDGGQGSRTCLSNK